MAKVLASMAGTVSEILVTKGDKIEVGQDVVILESMKMLIPIQSRENGIVKEVIAKVGEFINQDEVLLELEEE